MLLVKLNLSKQFWRHPRSLAFHTLTMSLRRSARNHVQVKPEADLPNGKVATEEAAESGPTKKRGRKSKAEPDTEVIASTAIAQDEAEEQDEEADTAHMPPPTTPNKRRKLDQTTTLPPVTPTPSAIAFMTSSSTSKPTPQPPATRLVKPHHTNAPLLTPGGTGVYSTFEDNASPSKAGVAAHPTNKTLLATACAHLVSVDPKLAPVIEKHYCKVFSPEGLAEKIDPFRSLASGIIAQQVSGAAASSIKNKFVSLFSPEECANGFPTPKAVTVKLMPELRSAGLSQRKAEYIQGLAEKFDKGELTVKGLLEGKDEDVMRELVAVRGLGRWSVEMFMCFGLKRLDVFSTGESCFSCSSAHRRAESCGGARPGVMLTWYR